jgi:hypothetical protein
MYSEKKEKRKQNRMTDEKKTRINIQVLSYEIFSDVLFMEGIHARRNKINMH